ncbi:MAG: L-seryl-tRNA(Sec) selenium transferase [bacterium]|nr:L-seryl-tRNA(Sec) selenium transferase [bacterium]
MKKKESPNLLRSLPSVDDILKWDELEEIPGSPRRPIVVKAIREVLAREREKIRKGERKKTLERAELVAGVKEEIAAAGRGSLRRVINGTGVVIHTNLGRARLAPQAVEKIIEAAGNYTNLEFALEPGGRGERSDHVEGLFRELVRAEAGLVVNNNAGAVLLVLNTLAEGREVIVSRGELIEIGGSFRIPEVMSKSGAVLKEVGTTNRTYIRDYARAIKLETGLLFRAHPSNYRIEGFTARASRAELVALSKEKGLPFFEDLGSGLLHPIPGLDLSGEPGVALALKQGVDVVSFSGDKLLGGPQAGIILGRKDLLDRIRKNPLARALRIDKLSLAALEATLRIYRGGEVPPVISALQISRAELEKRAGKLSRGLQSAAPGAHFKIEVAEEESTPGGGSFPGVNLPTLVVALTHPSLRPEEIAAAFRAGEPPVVGRIQDDRFFLDLRTISPEEIGEVARAFREVSQNLKKGYGQ